MVRKALIILWIIWFIPMLLYIIWKRGDWYLFIIPPVIITIISLCISIFSEMIGIMAIIVIHTSLIALFIVRMKK